MEYDKTCIDFQAHFIKAQARLLIPFLKFLSYEPKRNRNYRNYGN